MIELIKTRKYEVDWPGWSLLSNQFGDEFDEAARVRMIIGGKRLIPFIAKHKARLGKSFLEIGPFFNPVVLSRELSDVISVNSFILFLENDPFAIDWLKLNFNANVISLDINDPAFSNALATSMFNEGVDTKNLLDCVLISQVLNYIDFRMLLETVYTLMKPGGLLFINNVIDYGIPPLFSPGRPRSNEDLEEGAINKGFKIVEKEIIPRRFRKETNDRLILVLEK
ncbi:MAG: hypothetical protein JNM19_06260 [Chitinophagaceae bacterium]|nr:hypothetical protein [Chitinophagaceae bacterium]